MKAIGFVGASGTGKSYRSTWVAGERGIEYIIDDGLLIKGSSIVAGESAKREKTKIASIKRALFTNPKHAQEVKEALEACKPDGIMILGTSDGMVETIAKRIGIGELTEKVYIQDVADENEIAQALAIRREQGKHVIPVPTLEIKRDFSGYFLDPLRIFKKRGRQEVGFFSEKSVVRPTFSYLGKYTISDYTIYQIIERVAKLSPGLAKIPRFHVSNNAEGVYIDMDVVCYYGYALKPLIWKLKGDVALELEKLAALNVERFDVCIKSLLIEQKVD